MTLEAQPTHACVSYRATCTAATKNQSDKRVVTLFTRTGYITTSELVSEFDYSMWLNQFHYAERGETE